MFKLIRPKSADHSHAKDTPVEEVLQSRTNPATPTTRQSPVYSILRAASPHRISPGVADDYLDVPVDFSTRTKTTSPYDHNLYSIPEEQSNVSSKEEQLSAIQEVKNPSSKEWSQSEAEEDRDEDEQIGLLVKDPSKKNSVLKNAYYSSKAQTHIGFSFIGELKIQFRKVIVDLIEKKTSLNNEEKENIEFILENFISELNKIFKSDNIIIPLSVVMFINMQKFSKYTHETTTISEAVHAFIWATVFVSYERLEKTLIPGFDKNTFYSNKDVLREMSNPDAQIYRDKYNQIPRVNKTVSVVKYDQAYFTFYNYKKGPERQLDKRQLDRENYCTIS